MDDFSGKIIIEWPFRDGKEWGIWKKFSILCGSKLWQNSIGNESKLTTLKCNQAFEHNMKTLEIPVCCQLGTKLPILNITWHIYCKLMENECCSFACFCGFHIFENYITWMLMTLVDQLCKKLSNAICLSTRDLIWDLLSDSINTLLEFKSNICTFAHIQVLGRLCDLNNNRLLLHTVS